jgi:hypothetical protein
LASSFGCTDKEDDKMTKSELASISFTSWVGGKQGYEDYPSFQKDIWPLIENHLDIFKHIYVFQHKQGPQIGSLPNISLNDGQVLFCLGHGKDLKPEALNIIKAYSYFSGDRNVYYQVSPHNTVFCKFITMWPRKSKIELDLEMLDLDSEDRKLLYEFGERVCSENSILFTFQHDADTIFVIGQHKNLELLCEIGD